jgi:hypothetical protein
VLAATMAETSKPVRIVFTSASPIGSHHCAIFVIVPAIMTQ